MNKFNENVSVEETESYKMGELMDAVNNDIEVGDKVQWVGFRGDTEIVLKGVVESIGEFNNVKNFTIRKFPELGFSKGTITQVSASRVSKA